ncbi:MAG TPA: protein-methionine-sulfoxide reductase catalytic subunit MsrP [Anaerolineales bacterium]
MQNKYRSVPVLSSEITPESLYRRRRDFMKAAGFIGGSALLAACAPSVAGGTQQAPSSAATYNGKTDELGDPLNTYQDITNYNNYYEFSEGKEAVAPLSAGFKSDPWSVEVTGLVSKPRTFAMEDLLKMFPQEDRIYRLRCVEAWSMVIPWRGFPLASLLKTVEPTTDAKYVAFTSLHDSKQFPGQASGFYPWPYTEGLRLDEAMNDLALMVTGLYGAPLPPQDGAPLRLVVPWKYGFKGIKAIVKIELVAEQPETFWKTIASNEYGFYANVNPDVPHPRWLQSSERRIGELSRRPTLMFNGYAEQVASLYAGMDLSRNY